MRRPVLVLALLLAACSGGGYRDTSRPIVPVAELDLSRYEGRWYEVARFPVRFQRGCVAVTADYALRADGRVDVVNRCRVDTLDGRERTATATARPVGPEEGRLAVRFISWLPIEGDYWVIHLDDAYRTAVVAVPSGNAGWILSRTPQIEPERLAAAEAALAAAGYDLEQLRPTPQAPGGIAQ